MDDLQLQLCDIQGRLFELSATKGYDSASFVQAFMMSDTARCLDSEYNRMQWAGEEYLLAEVAESALLSRDGEIYHREVLYWMGYLYRYWHYQTGEPSQEIYKQASVETMSRNWLMFHTLAPELAISNLKEIFAQSQALGGC